MRMPSQYQRGTRRAGEVENRVGIMRQQDRRFAPAHTGNAAPGIDGSFNVIIHAGNRNASQAAANRDLLVAQNTDADRLEPPRYIRSVVVIVVIPQQGDDAIGCAQLTKHRLERAHSVPIQKSRKSAECLERYRVVAKQRDEIGRMPLHGVDRPTSMRKPRQRRLMQVAQDANRVALEGGIEAGNRDVQLYEAKLSRGNQNRVRSKSDDRTCKEKRYDRSLLA